MMISNIYNYYTIIEIEQHFYSGFAGLTVSLSLTLPVQFMHFQSTKYLLYNCTNYSYGY